MGLMQIPRKLTTASRDAFCVTAQIDSKLTPFRLGAKYVTYLATDAFNVFCSSGF